MVALELSRPAQPPLGDSASAASRSRPAAEVVDLAALSTLTTSPPGMRILATRELWEDGQPGGGFATAPD